MKLNGNFLGGRGGGVQNNNNNNNNNKILPWGGGGVWIFSGSAQSQRQTQVFMLFHFQMKKRETKMDHLTLQSVICHFRYSLNTTKKLGTQDTSIA